METIDGIDNEEIFILFVDVWSKINIISGMLHNRWQDAYKTVLACMFWYIIRESLDMELYLLYAHVHLGSEPMILNWQ